MALPPPHPTRPMAPVGAHIQALELEVQVRVQAAAAVPEVQVVADPPTERARGLLQ